MRETSSENQALESVYRSSWLGLTRLAYLLVGDRAEAEDIVQAVFTTAAPRWDDIHSPSAYLRQAVVYRAKDVHRRSYERVAPMLLSSSIVDEPDVDEMWGVLQALPPTQRAVVVLRFYEDLELADIATMLDRPASTVRSDLRRALLKLRGLV